MREHDELHNRRETALLWLEHEYQPVVSMLRDADLIGDRTDTEAYMKVVTDRYRLLRTHRWDDEILQQVIEGEGRRRR
jgi:hypothetical protein